MTALQEAAMTAERAAFFLRRFKSEEKMLGSNEQAAIDFALAALAQQGQQPQGWKLVPVEPTDEMMHHFAGTPIRELSLGKQQSELFAYRAMLAAAPAPAAQETTGCACRWDADDNRVATCETHQGWLEVVGEWYERAKAAEAALQSTSSVATQGDFKEWVSRAYREPHSTFTIHNMEVAFAAGKQHEQANHTRAEASIPKEVMGMIIEITARYFQNQLECMDFRDKNFWAAGQTALSELEQKLKERFGPIA